MACQGKDGIEIEVLIASLRAVPTRPRLHSPGTSPGTSSRLPLGPSPKFFYNAN